MNSDLDTRLRAIWERQRPRTFDQLARVAAATRPNLAGATGSDADLRVVARAEAHKLAGALGMYGFREAGALAEQIDDLIVAGALERPDGRRTVGALTEQLLDALRREV